MTRMMDKIKGFWSDDRGVSAVEYALLLALIGAGIAAAALALGNAVTGQMNTATSTVQGGGS